MIINFQSRDGRTLHTGDYRDAAAALTFCAANGVDLTRADFRGHVLDGADISGLIASKSDWRGVSARGLIANRVVNGRTCELSSSLLQGADFAGASLTVANLACTQITSFRVETGPGTHLRGCDWSACPDVIVLPVRDDRVGRVIALRNGTGWKIHAGTRGVLPEAEAKVQLAVRPEYAAALAYLDSAECLQRKAEIEARPSAGTVELGAATRK